MKLKMLVAALMVAGSSVAMADTSVTLGYGVKTVEATNTQNHVQSISAKTSIGYGLSVDAGIIADTADVSNVITNRYEAGLSGGYDIPNTIFNANLRVATGMKATSAKADFGYYSLEPGINAKFGDITARVGYRYRSAYDTVNADQNDTMRYSVAYNLTKQDKFTLGWDRQTGDGANKTTTFAYTRSF